jgi:hypothetical protein
LCFAVFISVTSRAQIEASQLKKHLDALCANPSRVIGSSGYYASAAYVEREIGKIQNVELKRHEFPVMVPVTESATLDFGDGRVENVYPFWPAQVRLNATPLEGIRGRLVYCGECKNEQIRPASLMGQIAVVEASAGQRWVEGFYNGAKAELILGTEQTTWADLQDHDLRIPINLPRFYLPPGKIADELRAGGMREATLKASANWQRKMACNYYALVRPSKPAPDGWTQSKSPAALMFSVPMESSSLVPDLSPGAGQAVQTAAGLALLREIAAHPWDRPVVVFFCGADSIQHLGTRNMFMALGESPQIWQSEIADLDKQIATVEGQLQRAREVATSPQQLSIRSDRQLIDRISKFIETDLSLEQDQLFRMRSEGAGSFEAHVKELEDRQISLNRLMAAFDQNPKQLADSVNSTNARAYLARTIARLGGDETSDGLLRQFQARKSELNNRIELYHWLAKAVNRNENPEPGETGSRLIELLIGLDFSDRGTRVGPMFWGYLQHNSAMGQIVEYADWFAKLQDDPKWKTPTVAATPASPLRARGDAGVAATIPLLNSHALVDFEPLRQLRAPSTYLAGPLAIASELSQAFATPGLSMVTLNDLRLRRDTPNDTLASINVDAIIPQLQAVHDLFATAQRDPKFHGPEQLKQLNVDFTGQVVSASGGRPMPDLPREGFLATYSYIATRGKDRKIPQLGLLSPVLGVRRCEVRDCDADGVYRFEGLPKLRSDKLEGPAMLQNDMQVLGVLAYRVDPNTGAITGTTDLGKQADNIKWSIDIKVDVQPVRSVVFNCEEFALTGLYDPRYLQTLGEVVPLDARRNAEPQQYSMMLGEKMLAGFVEPGDALYLLIRYGMIGNRLILLNTRQEANAIGRGGVGYTAKQLSQLGPLSLATSHDFFALDDHRLSEYRRAGVSSSLVDSLHESAGKQIKAADEAIGRDDGVSLVRNSTGAWANEARVYDAAQDMARDVVRAAIFLLMLCVPFAFCMERLLIGTSNVYKQIAGASTIFAVMAAALWSFHPAFKISASPMIIILAFAIILMSCVVIAVVYGKFDLELKRLRSGRGSAGGASFASAGVMMSAILLGIANMRKRKFRTLLTSITIVLITFAVLCFTSTAHYVGTTTIPTGMKTSHPGISLRQRGYRPMPAILASQLRAVLADPVMKLDKVDVVEHWWAVSSSEPKEQYNLSSVAATPASP